MAAKYHYISQGYQKVRGDTSNCKSHRKMFRILVAIRSVNAVDQLNWKFNVSINYHILYVMYYLLRSFRRDIIYLKDCLKGVQKLLGKMECSLEHHKICSKVIWQNTENKVWFF